jgi:hypothetical protein
LKLLLASFGQLDFHIVDEGNGCFVIGLVMNDVIKVDQVGFMGAEEIIAGQAVFDLFQDTGKQEFFATCGNDLSIPASGNATKNLFHPENFDSPGGFNRYFR